MFIYKNRNNIYITDFFTMKDEKVILKRYYFILLIVISLIPILNIVSLLAITIFTIINNDIKIKFPQKSTISKILKWLTVSTNIKE